MGRKSVKEERGRGKERKKGVKKGRDREGGNVLGRVKAETLQGLFLSWEGII